MEIWDFTNRNTILINNGLDPSKYYRNVFYNEQTRQYTIIGYPLPPKIKGYTSTVVGLVPQYET
jgi:hypothetical protein